MDFSLPHVESVSKPSEDSNRMSTELNTAVSVEADPAGSNPAPHANNLRSYHLWMLLASATVLLAAFLLRVRSDQRVELAILPNLPLPELCQSRIVFGVDCPGCGLTRSFVHLAAGDVQSSLAVNPVGWIFAAVVLLQLPYRLWAVCTCDGRPLGRLIPWVFVWAPFALLFASWLARLVGMLA
jgi:hypothetical protein